ncbi:hypothetical protein TWF730_007605 [Orbilia blumenaviensis]|uniref:Uncharacterized protein n=1 Tax=Orbilia blumenaviensis TaxID=1796055 RepID=A0AAV9VEQ6_9PEZI
MIRIRSKEDFFLDGASPCLNQNRRRNRMRFSGIWQEKSQVSCGVGGSVSNPWVIDDTVAEHEASEPRPGNLKCGTRIIANGMSNPPSSTSLRLIESQQELTLRLKEPREWRFDTHKNSEAEVNLALQETARMSSFRASGKSDFSETTTWRYIDEGHENSLQVVGEGVENPEALMVGSEKNIERGAELSAENLGVTQNSQIQFDHSPRPSPSSRIEYLRPRGDFGNRRLQRPTTSSNPQSPSSIRYSSDPKHHILLHLDTSIISPSQQSNMPSHSKYPCIFRGSRPGEPSSSPGIAHRPLVRARKRAAEEAGLTLEEYARGVQPKIIRTDGPEDAPPPPADAGRRKGKRRKPQTETRRRTKRAQRTMPNLNSDGKTRNTPSPSQLENGQGEGVGGVDSSVGSPIAPDNNQNLAHGRGTSPLTDTSSTISILSRTPSIMSRQPSEEPLPGTQLTEDGAARQQNVPAAAAVSPASRTPEDSQQQTRYLDSPERPTTISDLTDDEVEERRVFVPDRAAVQNINRLFFTPRPETLLTREEMSRFLDPNLLPRFNPALKRVSEPSKPTKK